jgi:hypothetical protein
MNDFSNYTTEQLKAEVQRREDAAKDSNGYFTCICYECGKSFKSKYQNSNICELCYHEGYL